MEERSSTLRTPPSPETDSDGEYGIPLNISDSEGEDVTPKNNSEISTMSESQSKKSSQESHNSQMSAQITSPSWWSPWTPSPPSTTAKQQNDRRESGPKSKD